MIKKSLLNITRTLEKLFEKSPKKMEGIKAEEYARLKYLTIEEKAKRLYAIDALYPSITKELFTMCLGLHSDELGRQTFLKATYYFKELKYKPTLEDFFDKSYKHSLWRYAPLDVWDKIPLYLQDEIKNAPQWNNRYLMCNVPKEYVLKNINFEASLKETLTILQWRNLVISIDDFNALMRERKIIIKDTSLETSEMIAKYFKHSEVSSFRYVNDIPYGRLREDAIPDLIEDCTMLLNDYLKKWHNGWDFGSYLFRNRNGDRTRESLISNMIEHIDASKHSEAIWSTCAQLFWKENRQYELDDMICIMFNKSGMDKPASPVEIILIKKLLRRMPYQSFDKFKDKNLFMNLLEKVMTKEEYERVITMTSIGLPNDMPILDGCESIQNNVTELDDVIINF